MYAYVLKLRADKCSILIFNGKKNKTDHPPPPPNHLFAALIPRKKNYVTFQTLSIRCMWMVWRSCNWSVYGVKCTDRDEKPMKQGTRYKCFIQLLAISYYHFFVINLDILQMDVIWLDDILFPQQHYWLHICWWSQRQNGKEMALFIRYVTRWLFGEL